MNETRVADQPAEVVVFGEALVDFYPETPGRALRDTEKFVRAVGGAPANLSVGLARLGTAVRLLTMLGDDEFGHYLHRALSLEGVDTSRVLFTKAAPTGMTFISLDARGQRTFMSCTRQNSAEWALDATDFEAEPFGQLPAFHIGSNLMPRRAGCAATFSLLKRAKAAGCLVSMDANLRLHHWGDPQDAIGVIREALSHVDILKVSDEEMVVFLEGDDDPQALFRQVRALGVRWLCVTQGPKGVRLLSDHLDLYVSAPSVAAIDTTGAGDGFCAGLLHGVLRLSNHQPPRFADWPTTLSADDWTRALRLANFVGAQVCTKLGATTALPTHSQVPWADLGF